MKALNLSSNAGDLSENLPHSMMVKNEDLTVWQLVKLGRLYSKSARYDEALGFFDRAIEMEPKESTIHYYRGVVNFRLNKLECALRDFERSMKRNPWNTIDILNYTGCIRFRLGDIKGARKDISRVLNANHGLLNDLVMSADEYLELMAI
ncbi:MAG: hypothetical protein MK081_15005 [Flavobacteriales bacterium]|nr:hypothetical protein [Flavobacteriales bacterium]